ncbi:MAG: non-homologous end-joining DNA ligase [Acidimicrobiales bacterium]
MSERVEVAIGDRTLSLSNLDKVLYPEVGFTKSQIIDYYARVAPYMLPHIAGRCMTLRRWPNGVDQQSFFEKRCPGHRPEWVSTALGPGDGDEGIEYCRIDEPASLVWTANLAALELHSPMARCSDLDTPTMLVFDLDPGEPAGIPECCRVALALRDLLGAVGLEAVAKTSGAKGMQLYVPLNTPHTHHHASSFALAAGQVVARDQPDKVLVEMKKSLRKGKVFVDWSQNSRHKTTIAPYSLRARSHPTVSTPLSWDEVSDGADGADGSNGEALRFEAEAVLDRVDRLGDLFESAASLEQQLPSPKQTSG